MAYNIKGAPFRYQGAKNVEDCITAEEVMQKAGLDWTVEKCELFAKMPSIKLGDEFSQDNFVFGANNFRLLDGGFATYRTDYNVPLGVVKDKYTPVQNVEAFSFFNDAIGVDKAIWQTAGYFGNGERIFVSAKLPDDILVNGDPVENYLVFTTSHDGSTGVKILFTPIRVVCQNTLNAAIRNAENYVSFKHTKSVHDNIQLAKEILGISKQMTIETGQIFTQMANTKWTDDQCKNYLAKIVLNDGELTALKENGFTPYQLITRNWNAIEASGVSTKKVNTLVEMHNYMFSGPGQKEILGTAWGAYNAVTGYYSNIDNAEGTKRMDSLLFGDKARKLSFAGTVAVEAA